jgi:hypothetical protein
VPPGIAADDVELLDVAFELVIDVLMVVKVDSCEELDKIEVTLVLVVKSLEELDKVEVDLVLVVTGVPTVAVGVGTEPLREP